MDRLKKLLDRGEMVLSAWSGFQDPFYLAALAKTGFDAVTMDMQHGMHTETSLINGIAAILPTGKPAIVRVPVGRFDLVSRALDAGAHAIIAPMINTVEDAKKLVSHSKYVPVGDRSVGIAHILNLYDTTPADYITTANENCKILAMIETAQAVENMDAILDLDGIDGIFCGPGDLSISVRQNPVPDAYGPDTIDIVRSMPVAAKKRGKLAFTWCGNLQSLELVHEMGFDYGSLGPDMLYLRQGIDSTLDKLSFRKS